ncbi:MAG: SDR family oxidoreductase [Spongiibacteraceae bacterium]|nr:SDR family oxidoreductase [Spongiibacteraceae bacterium]
MSQQDSDKIRGERLKDKVALVTGFGAGIGKGCALMFARQGAKVIGCDISPESAQSTVTQAQSEQLNIENVSPCDLRDEQAVQQMMARVIETYGRLDIVVNAAASAVFSWVEEMTYTDWRFTLEAELDTVFLVNKAAWPYLKASDGASIINFASANAYVALEGSAALAHCAGKGGVLAMSRQLAMEGAPHGIRVNTISPGMIITEATKPVLEQEGFIDNVMAKNMLKRLGKPEDIAWCAVYLGSNESTYVTAADFSVDAGATAW